MPDLMATLVEHVSRTTFSDLPPAAVDYAKRSIIDTIAVTIAGSSAEGCREVVELVKEWGGKEESTIWVYGGRVPATLAGLAIGPMARARDFGDVHEGGGLHITEYVLPTLLPVAERQGRISGKDFLTALALAQDVGIRLQASVVRDASATRGTLARVFGPTAGAAKLLGLDEGTMMNAMGIAYAQAAGESQAFKDGALTVRMAHGFVADAAIKSVLLAERGITGARNILQGEYGFYNAFEPKHDLERLTDGLGKRFEGAYASMKPYPCCKLTHGAINAAIYLVKEHDIAPTDVAEIDVGVGERAYVFVCEPKEEKGNPQNTVDCQFSIPYTVATAVVKRSVFIDDFTEAAIRRPDVRELLRKVRTRVEPQVVKPDNKVGGAAVTIRTKDGNEYSRTVYYVKGHPKNPMTMNDVTDKLRKCLPFSARPLPAQAVEKIIELVGSLEQVDDVTRIVRLLAPEA